MDEDETHLSDPTPARARREAATVEELLPMRTVLERIEAAKDQLRSEWAHDTHRKGYEAAQAASRHRFAFALACIAVLAIALAMQVAYGRQNRERIERLERVTDAGRGR